MAPVAWPTRAAPGSFKTVCTRVRITHQNFLSSASTSRLFWWWSGWHSLMLRSASQRRKGNRSAQSGLAVKCGNIGLLPLIWNNPNTPNHHRLCLQPPSSTAIQDFATVIFVHLPQQGASRCSNIEKLSCDITVFEISMWWWLKLQQKRLLTSNNSDRQSLIHASCPTSHPQSNRMPSSRASCRYLHPVSACSKDCHRQGTVRRYAGGMPAPGCKLGSSYVCLPPFLRRPRRHTVHVVSHPRHQEPPRASTTSQTVG